jgi:hypothetical protein
MPAGSQLSELELTSLAEVARGFCHAPIPAIDAKRLLDLKLIYNLLGSYRILAAGRKVLGDSGRNESDGASRE